jgi:hypothetical protein
MTHLVKTYQGAGVGSIPIGRSRKSSTYRFCFSTWEHEGTEAVSAAGMNQSNQLQMAARLAGVRACAYTSSVNLLLARSSPHLTHSIHL